MPNLRSIATQYHKQANAIAARGDVTGQLTRSQMKGIEYYRDCAAKVEALILPEDTEQAETAWSLEGAERQVVSRTKVTSADKAATPQELLKKAE
jgi:hypothetical protein